MKMTWRILAGILPLVLLLAGCAASGTGDATQPSDEPGQTEPPVRTSEPLSSVTESTKPVAPETGNAVQLRLLEKSSGWWHSFNRADGGCYFLADSAEALTEGLCSRGIDPQALDLTDFEGGFFAANRLAVIPRTSNSGSVTYAYALNPTEDGVEVRLDAQMPEIGTMDMADWLVLIPIPLADYPADTAVTVDPAGNPSGGSYASE